MRFSHDKSNKTIRDHETFNFSNTLVGLISERREKYIKLSKINSNCYRNRILRKKDESKAIFFRFKSMLPEFIFKDAEYTFDKINQMKIRGKFSALEHQVLISIKISLLNYNIKPDEIMQRIQDISNFTINNTIYDTIVKNLNKLEK
jgi:hypothetical protein